MQSQIFEELKAENLLKISIKFKIESFHNEIFNKIL